MLQKLNASSLKLIAALAMAGNLAELERVRKDFLGLNGSLTLALRELARLDPNARIEAGKALNEAKTAFNAALEKRRHELSIRNQL